MKEVELRPAGKGDIPAIAAMATAIWNDYYPAIISQSQIDYMLGLMYSHESLSRQLDNGNRFFFITSGNQNTGFIAVEERRDELFISKFYMLSQHAGQGLGKAAFRALLRKFRPRKVSLTVNRQNFKAINFYFGIGFRIERVADFDIGNGYVMNDFVMTCAVRE